MPLGSLEGIGPGSPVIATGKKMYVSVGYELLGRVLDGLGRPMDGFGQLEESVLYPIYNEPPDPLTRKVIKTPLPIGIKAIDGLLTIGRGQRIGIFAGSGVGKSTLMGMIARNTAADINVIGLIGERGREVRTRPPAAPWSCSPSRARPRRPPRRVPRSLPPTRGGH